VQLSLSFFKNFFTLILFRLLLISQLYFFCFFRTYSQKFKRCSNARLLQVRTNVFASFSSLRLCGKILPTILCRGEHKIRTRTPPEIVESPAGSHVGLKWVFGEIGRKLGYVWICTVVPIFVNPKPWRLNPTEPKYPYVSYLTLMLNLRELTHAA